MVRRGAVAYAVLNLYPYSPGHLMVCPYRHVADYTELTDDESAEIAELTRQAMTTLRAVTGAQGFNIGMNQGDVAGAGIAAHLHQHVVPRWGGDTNFMPVVARTKVLPQLLRDTRTLLADAWPTTPPTAIELSTSVRLEVAASTGGDWLLNRLDWLLDVRGGAWRRR